MSMKEKKEAEMEEKRFAELKVKYKATEYSDSSPRCHLYKVLKKIDADSQLGESDIKFLLEQKLTETLKIVSEMEEKRKFAELKVKYKATEYSDSSPHLYKILKKIDAGSQLGEQSIKFLRKHQLTETLKIVMEEKRKFSEIEAKRFAELKVKYKASKYEDSSPDSHLYKVLKKIDAGTQLGDADINLLKKRKLIEIWIKKCEKIAASIKFRIEAGEQLSEADIDWLKNNGREDVIIFARQFAKEKAILKKKYDVSKYKDQLPSCPLYAILQKLEKGERLEEMDVAWLQENKVEESQPPYSYYSEYGEQRSEGNKLFNIKKIRIAYHKIEATFYEQEYDRTGNKWNLPNASSHWRKAEEPRRALKVTGNLNFNTIKENKLKSALLTTRGGAFRDLYELDDAEKCARKAIEYQPQSHHPYTLMGAICFERGQYFEGERWFYEAIKRGASPRDMDAEIKRVVKNADNNKRQQVVEYLLKKDPERYAWAKSYRRRRTNQKRRTNDR